jgi:hypothetical protein
VDFFLFCIVFEVDFVDFAFLDLAFFTISFSYNDILILILIGVIDFLETT